MAGSFKWEGEAFKRAMRAEMVRRINTSCYLVLGHAKQLINVEGTTKSKAAGKRDKHGRFLKGSGRLIYGANPSAPGEPPHKQRGRLLASVAKDVDPASLTGRVGTNLKYGLFLELGTRLMAARPWLRRSLAERREQVKAILSAPMKGP